jgi:hypothetical protein
MGSRMPRIYAALDNKQAEFQSHMIEVEGMINNQPLVILNDLGASHSYIDPRVVESLHLTRSKHEKSWLVKFVGKYLTNSEWKIFNRQRMLVIDGKYNNEDRMSTGSL